jgi:hypothetical protein
MGCDSWLVSLRVEERSDPVQLKNKTNYASATGVDVIILESIFAPNNWGLPVRGPNWGPTFPLLWRRSKEEEKNGAFNQNNQVADDVVVSNLLERFSIKVQFLTTWVKMPLIVGRLKWDHDFEYWINVILVICERIILLM